MSYDLIYQILAKKYDIVPHMMQLYKAKRKELEGFEGKHSDSYSKLPRYVEIFRAGNHGATVKFSYMRGPCSPKNF